MNRMKNRDGRHDPAWRARWVAALVRICGLFGQRLAQWRSVPHQIFAGLGGLLLATPFVGAQELPQFDFTQPATVRSWEAANDIAGIEGGAGGMVIALAGNDPFCLGPPRDYPAELPLWLTIRLRSDRAGPAQVFFFKNAPREEDSVRFDVPAGEWVEKRVPVPPLGVATRLRFDPPGSVGEVTLAALRFEPRVHLPEPQWPPPTRPDLRTGSMVVESGGLKLTGGPGIGSYLLSVNGREMAIGCNRPQIGYALDGQVCWLDLAKARTTVAGSHYLTTVRDPDGAVWQWRQGFEAGKLAGTIEVTSSVTVDHDRSVVFLPLLVLFPGAGSFGETKHQAIFPGLEYLANEPSSSEADLIGPASKRAVPDSLKITMPMMAVQNGDGYIGMAWRDSPASPDHFSALFDSPDRIFHSGGHVMGVLFPGSDGTNRVEGKLLPYQGETLPANTPLTLNAAIFGGRGDSAVAAVKHFVAWHGLPEVPTAGDFKSYDALATAGWLDSKIRDGDLFSHAYWPGFSPVPAADAALLMDWLAAQGSAAAPRLAATAKAALARVAPGNYNVANVSHVTYPVAALVYGDVAANADHAERSARAALQRFEADGSVVYRKRVDGIDLGRTHFAQDANGLTAQVVANLLENAAFCGDPELLAAALSKLRGLDRFKNSVPRGAQTWEVPLHTPDILASAYLVRAYTRGYELTGDPNMLEQAVYWAWTGVPFIYLRNPTQGRVGVYSTIAVLGATGWQAPVWLGQPVQWCGLVYADAIYRLAEHERTGPWRQLADGITAVGIAHTALQREPEQRGLLPDYFLLRPQLSSGPAINPGTVQTNAVRLFEKPALYDFLAARDCGLRVNAPGPITDVEQSATRLSFRVKGWPKKPYFVLINGLRAAPQVLVNGHPRQLAAPDEFLEAKGRLVLQVSGEAEIEVRVADPSRRR